MDDLEWGATLMVRILTIVVVLGSVLLSAYATAEPFVGFKLALMDVDGKVNDDPLNIAVNFGYSLDTWIADLSVVAEHNHTVDSGKTRQGEELELNANSVYLLWKTTRSMYVSLRAGAAFNEIVEAGNSRHNAGLLLGVGIGQVIGRTRLQLEYTSLAGDAKFLGIGLELDL